MELTLEIPHTFSISWWLFVSLYPKSETKKELEFRFMENLHLLEGIALLRFLKKTVDETG